MHVSDLLSGNNRKTHRCWSTKNNCGWAHLPACGQKYGCTSRLVTTGSVLGYCGSDRSCGQRNPVLPTPSPLPHPSPLISCIFGRCLFCKLVSICRCGVRCETCEPYETQPTLLILPILENSCSESVLFVNVVNSFFLILFKGHTVCVVHVGVPKDYIYLNLPCLS